MKSKSLLSIALVMLLILGGRFYLFNKNKVADRASFLRMAKAARGTQDDPNARANFEWMRIRNPQTNDLPRGLRAKELAFARRIPSREALSAAGKGGGEFRMELDNWNRRGPVNIGGRTRALAIDVSNENIILAGGVSGGMWRSTDGGATWTLTTDVSALHSVTSIAQDPRPGNTNNWFYTTGELRGNSASGGGAFFLGDGIFKSVDNGQTWTILSSTVTNTPQSFDRFFDIVWNVVVDPSNSTSEEVYAATSYDGIWRSVDGGTTWKSVLNIANPISHYVSAYVDVAITSTGVVYATLNTTGIWRSADGVTWTDITPTNWPTTVLRTVIGIAPTNENVVYFLSNTPGTGKNDHSFWKYTYVSGDGTGAGGTWENRTANLPNSSDPGGAYNSQGSYDMVVKVKPDDANTVFIGGTNLYRSTSGFANSSSTTWIGGYYFNHHPDQHSLAFLPSNPVVLFSGNDGGVMKTTDDMAGTVAWTSMNNGYYTTQFYAIAVDQATSGDNVIIGGMQDNGTWWTNSASATTPWINQAGGDGAYCAVADGKTSYYISYQNGWVYRLVINATGGLTSWTRVDPTGATGYLFINPFILDPNDNKTMYVAGGKTIWRNSDLTAIPLYSNSTTSVNWTKLTNTTLLSNNVISALAASKVPANKLYYGTSNRQLFRLDNAISGNPTPVDIGTGKGFPAYAWVNSIAVDPADGNSVVVVFSNYSVKSVYYTTDGGNTWTDVSGNLEENPDGSGNGPSVRSVAILPSSGGNMYLVGTSTGLYSTTALNGAATVWAQEGAASIGNVVVDMVVARAVDGNVFVGTHGTGVYSANLSVSVNNPPVITSSPVTTATQDQLYSYKVTATDPDNDPLTFSLPTKPPWLSINASSGLISGTPTNTDLGNATVKVKVSDGNGGNDEQTYTLSVKSATGTHFQPIWSGNPFQPMNINVIGATMDGIDLVSGDELAVMDGSIIVGAGVVTVSPISRSKMLNIVASADDPSTSSVTDGFTSGHSIALRVWINASQKEYSTGSINFFDNSGNPISPVPFAPLATANVTLDFHRNRTQSFSLLQGWNIISFNVVPPDLDFIKILQPLISSTTLEKVLDEQGNAIERLFGSWKNRIGNMASTEGYYLKVNQSTTLDVTGTDVLFPLTIPLTKGWNIVSYPYQTSKDALTILNDLINAGILVKALDERGNAIELLFGNWQNRIGNFNPNEGYYVKVSQNSNLVYQTSAVAALSVGGKGMEGFASPLNPSTENANSSNQTSSYSGKSDLQHRLAQTHFQPVWSGNPFQPMNINAVEAKIDGVNLGNGDEIGVFDGDIVVGVGVINTPLHLPDKILAIVTSSDDPSTPTKDGFTAGDPIHFKVWKASQNEEFVVNGVQYLDNSGNYTNPVLFASLATANIKPTVTNVVTGIADHTTSIPDKFALFPNYPNPFNPTTTIRYQLPKATTVKLVIYNTLGQVVRTLLNGQQSAGKYSVLWNGKDDRGNTIASGIYIYHIKAGNFIQNRKMLLVK